MRDIHWNEKHLLNREIHQNNRHPPKWETSTEWETSIKIRDIHWNKRHALKQETSIETRDKMCPLNWEMSTKWEMSTEQETSTEWEMFTEWEMSTKQKTSTETRDIHNMRDIHCNERCPLNKRCLPKQEMRHVHQNKRCPLNERCPLNVRCPLNKRHPLNERCPLNWEMSTKQGGRGKHAWPGSDFSCVWPARSLCLTCTFWACQLGLTGVAKFSACQPNFETSFSFKNFLKLLSKNWN